MPILKITQLVKYKSSHLENVLERELLKYGILLPEPGIYLPEELQDGIYRTVEEKTNNHANIEICYWKLFEREDSIRISGRNTLVNESYLRRILNSNRVYVEKISLHIPYKKVFTEMSIENIMPYSSKQKSVKINISESPELFAEMLTAYAQSFHPMKNVDREVLYESLKQIETPEPLEKIGRVIKENIGVRFEEQQYIKLLVFYFIKDIKNS